MIEALRQHIADELEGSDSSVPALTVAKEDLGKIIGKHGRIAQAMQPFLNAPSAKTKRRVIVEIVA